MQLLKADPNMDKSVVKMLGDCPGSRCPLRPPAYPDLTGDGTPALVLALDSEASTDLWVYVVSGDSVRQVFGAYYPREQIDVGTIGHDLVVKGNGISQWVDRYHWNGKVLVSVPVASPSAARTS